MHYLFSTRWCYTAQVTTSSSQRQLISLAFVYLPLTNGHYEYPKVASYYSHLSTVNSGWLGILSATWWCTDWSNLIWNHWAGYSWGVSSELAFCFVYFVSPSNPVSWVIVEQVQMGSVFWWHFCNQHKSLASLKQLWQQLIFDESQT